MRVMGIDYGDARTGIAVSDAGGLIVGQTTVIHSWNREKTAEQIAALVKQHGVERLVMGLPRNMDGTEGARCTKSRRFAAKLAQVSGMPVALWDERRTTVSAAGILSGNNTFGADRKARIDSVSAAVILESFLNWRRAHPGQDAPETVCPVQE